jgi:hypothetical protein
MITGYDHNTCTAQRSNNSRLQVILNHNTACAESCNGVALLCKLKLPACLQPWLLPDLQALLVVQAAAHAIFCMHAHR